MTSSSFRDDPLIHHLTRRLERVDTSQPSNERLFDLLPPKGRNILPVDPSISEIYANAAKAPNKLFVNSTISNDSTNPVQASAEPKVSVNPTISEHHEYVAEAPNKRKLFVNSTISEDCTNPDKRSSSLLCALKDRPRKLMIKSSGIETGDRKRIRLR